MTKKKVILSLVLFLLVSFVSAQDVKDQPTIGYGICANYEIASEYGEKYYCSATNVVKNDICAGSIVTNINSDECREVCCLLPLAGECIYGSSSHTGLLRITKDSCEIKGGEVIGDATCNKYPDCIKGCCCEINTYGSKVATNKPEDLCENKEINFHGEQEDCVSYCQTVPVCGDNICEGTETEENCAFDCEEDVVTPLPGEEAVGCEEDSDCPEKCVDKERHSGKCENNECVYLKKRTCSEKCVYANGKTKCAEMIDCEPCNAPLGMFAVANICNDEFCYLDYTDFIYDAYFGCDIIDNCYKYKSSDACLESKCMPSQCKWEPTIDEFGQGMCMPIEGAKCEDCETIDGCDSQEECRRLGNNCNYNPVDGTCNEDNPVLEKGTTLKITLKGPNDGFATEIPYDVTIETDKWARCRYSEYGLLDFSDMNPENELTTTDNLIHKIRDISKTEDWIIYVNCIDENNIENTKSFEIGYDTDIPIIKSVFANPNPIIDVDCITGKLQTTLKVETDKKNICRYSIDEEKSFDDMQGILSDDYRLINTKTITGFQEGQEYIFNVKCKAMNWIVSENYQIKIKVDLSVSLEITKVLPKDYASSNIFLVAETNKCAKCRFYNEEDYGGIGNKLKLIHRSIQIENLETGEHTYNVECTKGNEKISKEIKFKVDTTAPEKPDVKTESYCRRKNGVGCKIKGTWSSKDDESGIKGYYYYILNTTSNEVLFKEFTDEKESEGLDYSDLGLESKFADKDKFKFLVSAQNNAGLWSENGTDTVTVDYSKIVADKKPPKVRVYFNKDRDLVLECEDKETKCVSLKYYLSSNGCPKDESLYDEYSNPITITSDLITTICWIAEDGAGNIEKDSTLISKIKKKEDKEEDKDDDGMPDSWENEYLCVDKNIDDALEDPDNDGLINLEEYYGLTDPCDEYPITTEIGDSDADGMLDSWEDKYDCIDKNTKDAYQDSDNDGLTNKEEYNYRTHPCDPDSDKDGYIDGVEIEKGTNPLDEDDYPKSRLWIWILIIILVLGGLGAASYFGYNEYKRMIKKKPKVIPKIIPRRIPLERKKEKEFKRKEKEKEERRKKLFEAFVPGKKEEKIEKIKPKKHEIDIFERLPKIVQEDIFEKLPGEKDVFKKLPKTGKEVFEKLPKPKVKKKTVKKRKKSGKKKKKSVKKKTVKRKKVKKSKKGQIAGQVIIYILAVLIFGLIVIFGYREISNLMEKQQKVDLINFENDLKDIINQVSSSYGDVEVFDEKPLNIPGEYNNICFIDLDEEPSGEASNFPLIKNSWDDKVKANVFFNDAEYSFYTGNVTIEEKSKCFDITDGKLRIRLEGIGGSTKISEVE